MSSWLRPERPRRSIPATDSSWSAWPRTPRGRPSSPRPRIPDVALVNAQVRGGGDDAVRAILAASPGTHVLAHTGGSRPRGGRCDAASRRGRLRGARRPRPKLMAALRAAAAGDTIFDGTFNGAVLRELMNQVHAAEPRPRGADHEARRSAHARPRRPRHRLPADRGARLTRHRGLRGALALRGRAAPRAGGLVRRGARGGPRARARAGGDPPGLRALAHDSSGACSWL